MFMLVVSNMSLLPRSNKTSRSGDNFNCHRQRSSLPIIVTSRPRKHEFARAVYQACSGKDPVYLHLRVGFVERDGFMANSEYVQFSPSTPASSSVRPRAIFGPEEILDSRDADESQHGISSEPTNPSGSAEPSCTTPTGAGKETPTVRSQYVCIRCASAADTATIHQPSPPTQPRRYLDLRILRV